MHMVLICAVLLATAIAAVAQAKPEDIATGAELAQVRAQLLRVDSMRELWIALPGSDVTADQLLKSLRAACDDTTAVAVADVSLKDIAATPSEQLALRAVATRAAIADLNRALNFRREFTRLVLLGVLDSCRLAAQVAAHESCGIDGLVLIDPAPADFELPGSGLPKLGVDALLHPRSEAEWERDSQRLASGLGAWGRSARVIRSGAHFDGLAARISELRLHNRGYTVLKEGEQNPLNATELAGELAACDVVFVGELHGNPGAHRVQLEMLRHFASGKRGLALATEQFERDVQPALDAYLGGRIDEKTFLETSRPWPNYADYRPLIELCKSRSIPVIAGNAPRRLASRVNKEGPEVIAQFSEQERGYVARELNAEPGAYRDKFMKTMGGMGGHGERLESMYAAQCIKDDTMAESVADWLKANAGARVLHINGNFHSAGGLGAPEKLAALMPELKIGVVTCVSRGDKAEPSDGEWIITVPAPRPD